MPPVNANSLRVGNIIKHEGDLYRVNNLDHVKPGKGGAFVQIDMKGVTNGRKLNPRIRSEETMEVVELRVNEYQFLYSDDSTIHLMDNESYEQIGVEIDIAGEQIKFLTDGCKVFVESSDDGIISIRAPETVVLEVSETEPYIKGQTAAPSYKPAILSNGIKVNVPPFVEIGEKVVVKTVDSSYVERFKG